jgi:hypothetical protein
MPDVLGREALDRSVTVPDRSITRSPAGSIRTIRSMDSVSSTRSGSGSASTVFMPPPSDIPDVSDMHSLSGSSSITGTRTRTQTMTIGPSVDGTYLGVGRRESLRRTSSLDDLYEEYETGAGVSRRRSMRSYVPPSSISFPSNLFIGG